MKLEVSEQFVKEAHKSACQDWKTRIEEEFPSLFEVKWESNKWYKLTWDNGQAIAYVNSDGTNEASKSNGTKGFGVRNGGLWDSGNNVYWGGSIDVKKELATPQEIETMLWKEAEKRGIGKDTKIERHADCGIESYNTGIYELEYDFIEDELWNLNGCIYKQGRFATPLNENKEIKETISRLEKELKELKERVK